MGSDHNFLGHIFHLSQVRAEDFCVLEKDTHSPELITIVTHLADTISHRMLMYLDKKCWNSSNRVRFARKDPAICRPPGLTRRAAAP